MQVLKYEARHDSALARFLLRRALSCPHQVGHQFFWCLKAEMHLPEVSERFGLLLQEYLRCCGPHRDEIALQHEVEQKLISMAELVHTVKKDERVALLRQELSKLTFPAKFQLALDPRFECSGLKVEKCKCMDSKKVPLWLVFKNADPLGDSLVVIFKAGDDLRQDALTLQIIRIMERKWEREGLDLKLSPYGCVSTGDETGFIEVVLRSNTTANITKKYSGGAGGAFSKEPMKLWLEEHNPGERALNEAVDTFCVSLAGYCVATYVMGIGDRHNDNVMLSEAGHLFHIDFGHFLGNFKSKFGVKRERSAFVFTPQMHYVMRAPPGTLGADGGPALGYLDFVEICCRAYNVVRRHGALFITLFMLMTPAEMPELLEVGDITYLRDMLALHLTEKEAEKRFRAEIDKALNTASRQADDFIHSVVHG